MKRMILIATAAAMALGATAASAQPYGYGGYNNGYNHGGYRDRDRDGIPNRYDRHDNRRGGYHRGYYRGGYLPSHYRGRSYVVYDYGRYGYRAPPRGYAYYRTDTGDVVMAAIATGLIASIIAGR